MGLEQKSGTFAKMTRNKASNLREKQLLFHSSKYVQVGGMFIFAGEENKIT
jgi:hypothetical protein